MAWAITAWYAQKMDIDPAKIVSVSVMPCTAKKFEVGRDDQSASGYADVDISITTRELARMIKSAGISFNSLPDETFDSPLGEGSGAGVIFGATGGVMEAALRTAVEKITGQTLENVDFTEVRGMEGVKEATYAVGDLQIKVAVASGTKNAKTLMEQVKNGTSEYQFIEIMACPGGCINGGGQPIQRDATRNTYPVRELRAKALYAEDASLKYHRSDESPVIETIYKEYFGEPNSEKAHHILHTSYHEREKY